jgi:hypothetical protein
MERQLVLWALDALEFLFVVALGYGIFLLIKRREPAFSKSRAGYFKGFGVGFVLLAASGGLQVFQGQQVPSGPWPWIDLVVEAVMGGLLAGAIGGWINRPRKQKQE